MNPELLKIIKITTDDEIHKCAETMVNTDPWITLARTYDVAVEFLRDITRENYIGTINDEIAGFIVFRLKGPFSGYIHTICVMPEWRGKGIGTKLIKFAEKLILIESPNVFMCVSSFNTEAQRLYKRLGYETIGELKDYIIRGHSEFLLRKTTGPLNEFKS